MQGFDVACVGNAKIDLFLSIHEPSKHLRLEQKTNEICFPHGEKIAVDGCDFLVGGNAANVSIGLSRLGLQSIIFCEMGADELSHKIINTLQREGVNTTNVKISKDQTSSISVIINYKNDRTIFSQHVRRPHDFSFDNLTTKSVYLTSIGEDWKNAYQNTVDYVKRTNALLAFNPGTLQLAAGYEEIKNVLEVTRIIFLNKQEAMKILNIDKKDEDIKKILEQLQATGPKIVVITDGDNGSFAIDENKNILEHGIIDSKVVQKTGAGDAYSCGFMAAILHELPLYDAMRWGTINSASVMEKVGAQNGLLMKEEMEKKLKEVTA